MEGKAPVELILFIGLQASGKTTFYRQRFSSTHIHISKDLMRNHTRPEQRQQRLIAEALAAGQSVVVDNTNPSQVVRAPLITLGRNYGAEVVGYAFEADVRGSRARNQQREGRARVPEVAIYTTLKRLHMPRYGEGFDRLYYVRILEDGGFAVEPLRETAAGADEIASG